MTDQSVRVPAVRFLVTEFNAGTYLERCLASLFSQIAETPFFVHVVDDSSTCLLTRQILMTWSDAEPERLTVRWNTATRDGDGIRLGKASNLLALIRTIRCDPEDVFCIVDGDDWLAHPHVVRRVVTEYQTAGCWVTYGSYAQSDGDPDVCTRPMDERHFRSESEGKGFRGTPWVFSHLFTAKAHLWQALQDDVIRIDDTPMMATADMAFNTAICEMASSARIRHVADVLYIYNNQNPLNDAKLVPDLQRLLQKEIGRQPPHTPASHGLPHGLTGSHSS